MSTSDEQQHNERTNSLLGLDVRAGFLKMFSASVYAISDQLVRQ